MQQISKDVVNAVNEWGEKRVERQREREYTEGRGWLGSCGEEGRGGNGRGELSGKEGTER